MSPFQNEVADLMADTHGRMGKTRRPLFRIYEIHSAIRGGSFPNCSKLAEQLCVQRQTIQRDITFMRDELKLPVKYEESLHGYCYDEDMSDFLVFQTTAEELAGLFPARTALESVRGTPLADVMQQVFGNLTRGMQGKIQFAWSDVDEAFSRKTVEQSPRDVKLFGVIAESVLHQLVTTFDSRKPGAEQSESRRVQPLHLGEVDGGWYLIAHDLERVAPSTFGLPRISRFKVTTQKFERPPYFVGNDHLKQSFGIWSVAGDFSVAGIFLAKSSGWN